MPFTLAHPAAVIPLRNYLPFAPLVAGSIAPDLAYFFAPTEYFREYTHTFVRSFTFCLPAGLCFLLLLWLLRPGLERLLPAPLRETSRIAFPPAPLNARALLVIPFAVLVGAWSHILWDSFTHPDSFIVANSPFLQSVVFPGWKMARILQHISTLFGFSCLVWFAGKLNPGAIRSIASRDGAFWICIASISITFAAFTYDSSWNIILTGGVTRVPFLLVVSTMRAFALLAALASLTVQVIHLAQPQRPGRSLLPARASRAVPPGGGSP